MSLFNELKRRNVFRVGIAYIVAAWLLLQLTDVLVELLGLPENAGKYVILLLVIGFPVALFFAWAFELTPQGIKKEKDVDHSQSITYQTGRKLDFFIIGMLVVALSYFAYDKFVLSAARDAALVEATTQAVIEQAATAPEVTAESDKSIAVLLFVNISSDPEQEYFSDGITEEIISKLARIENLSVASRTSVLRFKNTELDIREIAATLGVRYILEGSVRKAGDRLRITAQLIDSESGFHVWTEDFDGSVTDIFDVQERTALQIAEALNIHLSPQERQAVQRRYINNSEAYDSYLRGQALLLYWNDFDKLMAASAHFESALELEPDYPLSLAGLASVEAQIYRNHDTSEARLVRGMELANRALALDPGLVRGHIAVGELAGIRYDYRGAAGKFREAIAMEPDNAWAWDLLSWALAYQQPPDPAGSEVAAREAIRLLPQFANAYYHLGRALNLQVRYEEAIIAFERILEFDPDTKLASGGLSQSYLELGEIELARKHSEIVLASGNTPIALMNRCFIEAADGNHEGALEYFERALELDYRDFETLAISPHLEELRADPRYLALITRFRQ